MKFTRHVEPELLDELRPDDPGAIRSRRDLRHLNVWMGNVGTMARILQRLGASRRIQLVVDLGSGDGTFLLAVARQLGSRWNGVTAVLVDRVMPVSTVTQRAFEKAGWKAEVLTADVRAGLAQIPLRNGTLVIANLFLHHFPQEALRELLAKVAVRAEGFAACEPRRSRLALGASRLLGLIGCNAVTRHDAVVSVRAGFEGREIAALWPREAAWSVEEGSSGPFSHVFSACLQRGIGAP